MRGRPPDVERVLVRQQPHVLELDAVGQGQQCHGLCAGVDGRAPGLRGVVGDGQVSQQHVGAGDHRGGAARRAVPVGLRWWQAGLGRCTGRLGQAVVAAVDQGDGAGIARLARQAQRGLALHAQRAAVGAGAHADHPGALCAGVGVTGRHGIHRGLHAAVGAAAIGSHHEVGLPPGRVHVGRLPGRRTLCQVVGHLMAAGGGSVELRPRGGRPIGKCGRQRAGQHRQHRQQVRSAPAHGAGRSARNSAGSPSMSLVNSTARLSGVNDGCGWVTWRLRLYTRQLLSWRASGADVPRRRSNRCR